MQVHVAALEEKDGPFVFRDVEMDAPRPDEILVRIIATGICHTDAHVRKQGFETPLPIVLGHEGAGIVEQVGSDVQSVRPGDHVIMSFPSCGRCPKCISGHPAYCDYNLRLSFGGARLDGSNAFHDGLHGHFFPQLFVPKLIELYRAGKFPFDRLVKFYDFEDIEQAFQDSKQGVTIKPILRIGQL